MGFIMGQADELTKKELSQKYFYMNYLTKNKPVKVVDGCEDWPAINKWNNRTYLTEEGYLTFDTNFLWRQDVNNEKILEELFKNIKMYQKEGLFNVEN